MKSEKERAPQLRPVADTECSRFEMRDFIDYLNDCMALPNMEEFERHMEACDECAARLHRYQVRNSLWEGEASGKAETEGERGK